ncbi:hypothetical protein METSMIALI_00685 [Methanobrevibacter smithii DSM 2375]|uniref:Uncharacterized protein n=1 Tax=Methanobrevibacter smithii DSM 2375 TaxID=483214 RepID=B9AEA7_METSM|nr:hypothetical protein METSMIALI_00685 [Methanobrevibacter smithii DSM 2375]BDF81014.1 hypothetical protein CE91St67_12900 [Methanobrevibacter smithii]BDF82395.1 hypothetical protein CE91St68_09520 [Methanobrevibacter smithii]
MKLIINMAVIDFSVLGKVVIYLDSPATLLILDMVIYPFLFYTHIKVGPNKYIKFVKIENIFLIDQSILYLIKNLVTAVY